MAANEAEEMNGDEEGSVDVRKLEGGDEDFDIDDIWVISYPIFSDLELIHDLAGLFKLILAV